MRFIEGLQVPISLWIQRALAYTKPVCVLAALTRIAKIKELTRPASSGRKIEGLLQVLIVGKGGLPRRCCETHQRLKIAAERVNALRTRVLLRISFVSKRSL